MNWYKHLSIGEKAQKEKQRLLKAASGRLPVKGLYFVLLPAHEKNLYDIISHVYLLQDYYQEKELYVVGIALGKGEAVSLAADLASKAVSETGSARIAYSKEDFTKDVMECWV